MTDQPVVYVCASEKLKNGEAGIRFPLRMPDGLATGFVVRHEGTVKGYVNRCAHVPTELDWTEGEFFDSTGLYLICSIHGARYAPQSGRCAGGPCNGRHLIPLEVFETADAVWWLPTRHIQQAP